MPSYYAKSYLGAPTQALFNPLHSWELAYMDRAKQIFSKRRTIKSMHTMVAIEREHSVVSPDFMCILHLLGFSQHLSTTKSENTLETFSNNKRRTF
jgi:hypothetical protein